ncbi:hypothetical protein G4B88_022545 [Cannabis sativa]|uniref:Reverse transcriptase zinc-binding domain-containing protein n=1 Tax=Cannabis sativa TaxID=3483 RepID=A0A7J6HW29_CANSA|nr:hypothetical protein G4B88_022545 [Cannabis sativa]
MGKLAYALLRQDVERAQLPSPLQLCGTKFGTLYKVPPKTKNIVWRAAANYLHTNHNLRIKKVELNVLCPICKKEVETKLCIAWFTALLQRAIGSGWV